MKINPSMYKVHNAVNIKQSGLPKSTSKKAEAFNQVLQEQLQKRQEVSFSKHANTRLHARNIQLSNDQLKRINEGIHQADVKGIKESLVLIDDVALVINVKNKVVVTAMEKSEQDNKVFTNIDGAVIL
ncbi:hypothetical protein HZI73_13445 [Vallitalea pronyensis]|uniref:Flagellar operon protein n=1 Tax=Vallitalea pronyensis TaxID=1348613 RepID=A0A8J8SH46_9FIRM|nr:TIGR02530 family flagellar biosynthesis protein [Vallitalea pronyensis]QUI23231.1 hypothetical protein HZI73_13445 [Vallitalea pronyensis]